MATCPVCGEQNPERARFCLGCGRPLTTAPAAPETRRTVTVLFADVTGSTALGERLDPEALRATMGRYFATMKRIIESHGGTVEKFIGDAVMAVFGIPQVHEDDALRAVRAAAQIRDELAALNAELTATRGIAIRFRTGVHTGEVVAGDPSTGQTLVTGDTVNTAARLEQAAPPGEILIGRETWSLVRDAVEVEAVEPVAAKGKAQPVAAYRLHRVDPGAEARRRRHDIPLVGREGELAVLLGEYRAAVAGPTARLVTVIGAAGVGKSRLVAELRAAVGDEARFLKGRCLSYGAGITYWPIGEIIRTAAGIEDADDAVSARAKIRHLVGETPNADVIATRVASAVGLSDTPVPQEEVFWAIRRLLERIAAGGPLVLVIEDVHWAEATLLELLEHLADQARDAAILIVCPARPELQEAHPAWSGGPHVAAAIHLDALPGDATRRLIAALPGGMAVPPPLRERIEAAAEGNPLYVEELLGMLVDDGLLVEDGAGTWHAAERLADVRIPTSISTLLAARLGRLAPDEQAVVGRASVVGRVFEQDAVRSLSPEFLRPAVASSLSGLVRKELVRPDRSDLVAGEAYRFRHGLIRDAAYAGLAKADRADLHERFVGWLESVAGDRLTELQEIVGYHLGQAWRYRTDLGEGETATPIGARAGLELAAAGRRARGRGDESAAARLLGAALAMPVPEPIAVEARIELATAHTRLGETALAVTASDAAFDSAIALGDLGLLSRARVCRIETGIAAGTLDDFDPVAIAGARQALEEARVGGDATALAMAYSTLATQAYMDGRLAESEPLYELAIEHAQAAAPATALELEMNRLVNILVGPTPAAEVVRIGEAWLPRLAAQPYLRADALRLLSVAEAMIGRHDIAEAHSAESVALLLELGQPQSAVNALGDRCWLRRLSGDLSGAEAAIREAYEVAAANEDRTQLSWVATRLAQVLAENGRLDEAEPLLATALLVPMVMNRTRVIGIRARILASRGEEEAARAVVRELIDALAAIEAPNVMTDGFVDAAEAMAMLGDHEAALGFAGEALRLAELKGNLARAAQVQAIIDRERAAAGAAPAPAQ
jgi:class 3 adenylate cyclase/tetratricopeptide (TPR) repeat protein